MTRSVHVRGVRGFTLMEMLVVLGILAVLLAMVVPRILGTQKKADISAAQSQIKLLRGCLQRYALDMKEFPTTEQGLQSLVEKPADLSEAVAARWDGPYTETGELPMDPWGNPFQYEYPPTHGTADADYPDIWSWGYDREDGTEDDIVSWSKELSEGGGGAAAPAKGPSRTGPAKGPSRPGPAKGPSRPAGGAKGAPRSGPAKSRPNP
jgi:general secretion pathway protein G